MKRVLKIYAILSFAMGCAVALVQAQSDVTFSVDMTKLVQAGSNWTAVAVAGSFNGWANNPPAAGSVLTNDPSASGDASNIYSGTISIADAPGTVEQYKFIYQAPDTIWESPDSACGNNRTFTLEGGAQTLPTVYWNDQPLILPTNDVTFSVDMTAQIQITGDFIPGQDIVYCRGGFEGWGSGNFFLTNNPSLSGNASNIYSGTWPLAAVPGACQAYKFYIDRNSDWESPASTAGANRTFNAAAGPQTLPTVFFNDASLGDFLSVTTAVTFNVIMTNAVGTDGTVFNPAVDTVWLNGDFLGWWAWGPFPPTGYQMSNNPPGSMIYSLTIDRPKSSTLNMTYKYSIDGADNENGFGINHFRYIRQEPGYNMPLDSFVGTNGNPPAVSEPYPGFGSLQATSAGGGQMSVSWLGRPGAFLESRSSLSSGSWTVQPGSDGHYTTGYLTPYGFVTVTNIPANGDSLFLRLDKP
jgi:hypothetical protein